MHIVVVGAGVVGVTTAFGLLSAGHSVEVLEADDGPGRGATAGNAGVITAGDAVVWANRNALGLLPRALVSSSSPVRVRATAGPRLVGWGLRFMRECRSRRSKANAAALYTLALASQRALERLADAERLSFSYRRRGGLLLFDSEAGFRHGREERRELEALGHRYEVLGASDIAEIEPALSRATPGLVGALYTKEDASGDSEAFTVQLASSAQRAGASFRFRAAVQDITVDRGSVTAVVAAGQRHPCDAVVVCAASQSSRLAARVGDRLDIYPVRGHTLTAPVVDPGAAPEVPGVHEGFRVAFSRMDGHMRLSSNALFAGSATSWKPEDFAGIHKAASALFPGAADWSRAEHRARLRPSTPNSLPRIGPGRYRGVWYNTGHSHLGWTLAAGSADLLVDQFQGSRSHLDVAPFQIRQ